MCLNPLTSATNAPFFTRKLLTQIIKDEFVPMSRNKEYPRQLGVKSSVQQCRAKKRRRARKPLRTRQRASGELLTNRYLNAALTLQRGEVGYHILIDSNVRVFHRRTKQSTERPSMILAPSSTVHGFTVLEQQRIPEISGTAFVMRHNKSNARLLYLRNDDIDKAFAIGFKTPPQDDTGVFHILEHSVLCGSDKFPVKEPFVDLLKSSMQTFLNAMTFSDKTMYPVASTSETDLFNLMDVYLDAVFHPAIYHKRAIFEQEGWHYELRATDDAPSADGESEAPGDIDVANLDASQFNLVYNGVVFNEMKGSLSNSSTVLYDRLQQALFPDTAYAFESGGTPRAIPELTYEQFLDEHRRHYRLDNSYTVLYGDLDIDHALAWLDERYFSPIADEQAAIDATRAASGEAPLAPRAIEYQQPVEALNITETMQTTPENAVAACGYVIGTVRDRTRAIACDILLDALFGSNEAPLKRAFLDSGIAEDVSAFIADAMLQPFAIIQLKKQREDALEQLIPLLERELQAILNNGLDLELVEASLSHAEFVMREHDFGISDGVSLAMSSLSGWLYDDDLSCAYIRYDDVFSWLRKQLNTGYFEEVLRSVFLENNHRASVQILPIAEETTDEQTKKLAETNAALTADERRRIVEEEQLLREMQMQPDSPEAQKCLPRLTIANIAEVAAEKQPTLDESAPVTCLRHHIDTHGIAYAYRYFDASHIAFEELPYLSILALVLGKLGTAKHNAAELDTLTQSKLGNLSFYADLTESRDGTNNVSLMLCASSSALESNAAWLATLPREVLAETDLTDTARIKDLLLQRKISLEQSFIGSGHVRAITRVRSYHSPAGVLMEHLSNVEYYRFLKDLLAHFDERAADLTMRLQSLAARLFVDDGCTISFTGADTALDTFWQAGAIMNAKAQEAPRLVLPEPRVLNEAFIVPSDVTYTSSGLDLRPFGYQYSGSWTVASRALSYDYLWNEVRVKGGAYGVGFMPVMTGAMRFYSYRDPHIDETLSRFAQASTYLRTFDPSQEEMDGFVISTLAGFDAPKKTRALIRRQDDAHFAHAKPGERATTRSQIIESAVESVRALADPVELIAQNGGICTFGNKEIIESSKAPLNPVDLFNE